MLWNSKQNQQRENIFKINQWRYKWCIHFTFDNNLEIAVLSCPETILVDVLILTTSQHNKMLSICWYLCNSFRFGLWTNTFNAYEFFYFVVVFITQKKNRKWLKYTSSTHIHSVHLCCKFLFFNFLFSGAELFVTYDQTRVVDAEKF